MCGHLYFFCLALSIYFPQIAFSNNLFGPIKFPLEIPIGSKNSVPKCAALHFNNSDSFVCVCDGTHCDEPEEIGQLSPGKAIVFISDPTQYRLNRSEVPMGKKRMGKGNGKEVHIRVDPSKQFQTILGFGGAFTDAAGKNMNSLGNETKMQLLRAYFDKKRGIRYTVGRVPLASCDFSTRVYSYCDTDGDFELKTFALAREDLEMKIPNIRKAIELSENGIRLFGTPWAAPGWMKTSGKMPGGGSLIGSLDGPYYKAYANYFRRFFEEYSRIGNITFWGLTMVNEPYSGLDPTYLFQAMWISPEMQGDFANRVLGPTLGQSEASKNVLIMAHDHNLDNIFDAAQKIFNHSQNSLNSSVAGLGYHWYADYMDPDKNVISRLHQLFPDHFFLATEACSGWAGPRSDRGPALGNWTRAQLYGRDIMRGLNNWAVGWTDWNLCLDEIGGPNWVNNFVDAPIIVNATGDEFYKQPMFYALAHFSRFVPPGSRRIYSVQTNPSVPNSFPPVEFAAFRTSSAGDRAMVILSNSEEEIDVFVEEGTKQAKITMPPKSFASVIWAKGKLTKG